MRIEAHDRFGNPINCEVTRVVVYDDHNNPVSVAVKHQENWLYVGHCRDPEFRDFLETMGISATYVLDILDPNTLKPMKK